MHIALNAQLFNTAETYRSAGVSTYSQQLLRGLGNAVTADGTEHRFLAFTSTGGVDIPGIHLSPMRWPWHDWVAQNPLLRIGWEQLFLPWHLRQNQVDLLHGLVNVLPLATRVPGVVTVHDLSFLRLPQTFPPARRRYLAFACRSSVTKARHVIAVSQQTADDLIYFFNLSAAKIAVVYNGVEQRFQPGTEAAGRAFRVHQNLPERFWLYLGTLEPRKNLTRLVRAFGQWRERAQPSEQEIKLVLAGGKGWYYEQIFQTVAELGLEQEVLFPGFVPDADLPDWYRAAEALIYPSLFEGFGLPVLEAMACGTPVLCSQASSLLEVVGDCALTFAAEDQAALCAGLSTLACQPALRAELSQRGLARAARFSWHRTAQETLAVYDQIS